MDEERKPRAVPVKITEEQIDHAVNRVVDAGVNHLKILFCNCDRSLRENKSTWICLSHGLMKREG